MKYSRIAFKSLLTILLSIVLISCTETGNEVKQWKKQASQVTIIRDNFGVPHIYGKSDADAVFGVMYAQCEDDFNRVEVNYINALGRMAEVEGEKLLFTDLRMKLYIDQEELRREYEESPEWLRKLMDAFADGVNYYLHTHPEVKPLLLDRFEPWYALAFSEGSIGGDIEQISVRDLAGFYGEGSPVAVASYGLPPDGEPRGSNGFAIAPQLNKNGNAMLLINPHTSFFFRSEVHMVSEEGLNAYGAVTWGQFFIYQGFNERCGWMHTSSKADAMDWWLETVEERDGEYYYKYGEEWRKVTEKIIDIPYSTGDSVASRRVKTYYTHHGPVIGEKDGNWVSISLMVEHEKALTQSYLRTKASGYEDFRKTMELKTNSSNNTVYADADGNIAYFHGNFIPVRDPGTDYNGYVDGSNPSLDWQGLHSLDEMIQLLNPENGWIQNCNSTPFTASAAFSPRRDDYPPYMSPDDENPRGIHAVKVLTGASDLDLDGLIGLAYDSFLPAFEYTVPALAGAWERSSRTNPALARKLKAPVQLLSEWDCRYSLESKATTLAVWWGQEILGATRSAAGVATGSWDHFQYIATSADDITLLRALEQAVEKMTADFGSWEVAWGEVNRYQRINGDIVQPFNDSEPSLPVFFASSRWGSLASFGARQYPGTVKMYGTSGNSFVAAVEFGEKVEALSILAGGISGDPESPHFDDQAVMYSKGEFKRVLFYREDIESKAAMIYTPGEEL